VLAIDLIPSTTVAVNLSSSFNRAGIYNDGATFSGGLDGGGSALSEQLVGATVSFGGKSYNIGPAGANDVVSATGQTITLPSGTDTSLSFLATGVDGNQAGQNFTVTYTDNSTQTFTQSVSDWFSPQNYTGESKAITMAYRDTSNGGRDSRTFYVYGYSFSLNSAKTVKSFTLPNDSNIEVLAIDVTDPPKPAPGFVLGGPHGPGSHPGSGPGRFTPMAIPSGPAGAARFNLGESRATRTDAAWETAAREVVFGEWIRDDRPTAVHVAGHVYSVVSGPDRGSIDDAFADVFANRGG
jgi:hypothetical protein